MFRHIQIMLFCDLMWCYIYIYTDYAIVKPQLCIMKPLLLMVKSPFYDNPNIMGISIPMNGRIITSPYPYANHGAGIFTVNNWVIFGAFLLLWDTSYHIPGRSTCSKHYAALASHLRTTDSTDVWFTAATGMSLKDFRISLVMRYPSYSLVISHTLW